MTFWNLFFILLIYIPLILLWVFGLIDLLRRKDISPISQALWALAIVLLPIVGMVIYYAARPHDAVLLAKPTVGDSADVAAQIEKYQQLRASGAITDSEYIALKAKVIG